jgi:hypothetical protein
MTTLEHRIGTFSTTLMETPNTPARSALRAITTGALIAGVLDATFAVILDVLILRAFSLLGVLQWIATGVLGSGAFSGGLATAALGVAIHFALAFFFATLYYVAAQRIAPLRSNAITFGLIYGAGIWLVMDLIVLPHSGVPASPFNPVVFTAFLIDHAAFVGLPIALAVKRYTR